jgi:tetratricopeptide (TPR) repeat protein
MKITPAIFLLLSALLGMGNVHGNESSVWTDPVFRNQFLGTYGALADVEPRVTAAERDQMEKLIPLLGTDRKAAAQQLEKMLKQPDASAVIDFTLGNIHFQEDDMDRAVEHYHNAIKKFPSFRRAFKNLGIIHVRAGRYAEAVKAFTRMIELGGGDGYTYGLMGAAYAGVDDHIAAESAYRMAALLMPDTLDWKLGLARSLFRQRRYADASALCDALIARHPDRADLWLLQANAFIGMKDTAKAAENFEFVNRMGKATAASLNTLGDIYVNEQLLDLAADTYARALSLEPGKGVSRAMQAAEVLAARGALPQAKSLIARIKTTPGVEMDVNAQRKLLKLEARLAVADGAGGEMARVLEEIVAVDPLDGEALMLLGQHYGRSGEPDRAIFYYERAANIEAFEAPAKLRHAQHLVSMAKYQDAVPLLRRAQELRPQDEVARYLEQVERIARARK